MSDFYYIDPKDGMDKMPPASTNMADEKGSKMVLVTAIISLFILAIVGIMTITGHASGIGDSDEARSGLSDASSSVVEYSGGGDK